MHARSLTLAILVVLATVLPYLLADDQWMGTIKQWIGSSAAVTDAEESPQLDDFSTAPVGLASGRLGSDIRHGGAPGYGQGPQVPDAFVPNTANYPSVPPIAGPTLGPGDATNLANEPTGRNVAFPRLVGPPSAMLEQLLSFDVTQPWMRNTWSRITTQVGELDLQGWRVPLALGDSQSDLVGSLTYYFDKQQHVQRILLHGYTGDPRQLMEMAQSRFQMQRIATLSDEVFAAEIEGQTLGALQVKYQPIYRGDQPEKRCRVLMELNRQKTTYGMSQEFEAILQSAREDSAANVFVAP